MRPTPAARLAMLSGLRWFGVGLVLPILVVLLTARGLPIDRIGLVMAFYGAVTMVSELPTGGLADTLGRRPVAVASAGVQAAALVLLAFAGGFGWILLAAGLLGVARALASGPVESWFVETVVDGGAVQPGLARGQVGESLGLGAGSVIGGQLPGLASGLPSEGGGLLTFSVPFLAAAGVSIAFAGAAAILMRPEPARPPGSAAGVVAAAVGDAISVPGLRRLLVVSMFLGLLLSGVELLAPTVFAAALGGADAASLYGVLAAAGFVAAALGASVSARLGRRALAAGAYAAAAVSVMMIAAPVVGVAVAGYLVLYVTVGLQGPVLAGLLHHRVRPAVRATMLSVDSLVFQFGGVLSGVLVGAVAAGFGLTAGFVLTALAAVLAALVIVRDLRGRSGDSSVMKITTNS